MHALKRNVQPSENESQRLPFASEILVQVISLLDKACDRTNARLVCKGFAVAGLPSITYSVNLSVAGDLLDRTRAIAEHPIVSKYITHMVCSGTQLLSDHVNYDIFQDWYRLSKNQTTELSLPLSVIYEQFVARDKYEKSLIHGQKDRSIFLLALQSFVNLKRITFTDVPLTAEKEPLARPQWPGVPNGGELWEPASAYRMFAIGVQCLCRRDTNLQELKLESSSHAIQDRIFSDTSQEYFGHMVSVFGNLRYFKLNVVVPDIAMPEDAQPLTYGSLGGLLAHATSLEVLEMASSYSLEPLVEDRCPPMLDVETLLHGFTWRQLTCLGLHGFLIIGHESLLNFFDHHRENLDNVELTTVRILHHPDPQDTICEAWKQLFDGLRRRRITFQKLRLSFLQDCYNLEGHCSWPCDPSYHGDEMLKYLRQGGANPLEPAFPISEEVN